MTDSERDARSNPSVALTPSGLGQYISYASCPRFFRLKFFDRHIVNERNWYNRDSGGNLFAELGLAYEGQQLTTLADRAEAVIGDADSNSKRVEYDATWATPPNIQDPSIEQQWSGGVREQLAGLIESLAGKDPNETEGPVVLFQTPMHGQIGVWDISGIADLITLEPLAESYDVRSRILEVKTSWKEKTSHQVQSTIYSMLLDDVVTDVGVDHDPIATVVNRELDLREHTIEETTAIDRPSRTAEINRLLKKDGELHQLAQQSFEEVGYRLERKCDGCPYNGVCFTKAIESGDPALLNLTQGNQQRLQNNGVESVAELSELFEREEGTKPYDYDKLPEQEAGSVRALESEGTLANRLDEIVQRAQVLRGEIDPSYEGFSSVEYLRGSGNGVLPEDNPHPNLPGGACPDHELIRVYLYVQHDHIRDRLALVAARVDCDQTDTRTVVELGDSFPTDREASLKAESELLESFFTQLIETIQETKQAFGSNRTRGYLHLYTYSQQERNALMEAVQRQPTVFGSSAVRDLLGLREGIEQPMVSVVHSDITGRLALRYPGTGLIQTVDQLQAYPDEYYNRRWFSRDDWRTTLDGEPVDLRDVFETGLFEGQRPYVEEGNSIRLLLGDEEDPDREPDGFYPLYNRFGNQIPLEYLWAARGKLENVAADPDSPDFGAYRYYDGPDSRRIGPGEVKAMALRLTDALEHVERAIEYKNWQIDKQPVELDQLPVFSLEDVDLARASQEYLDLEYMTDRRECYSHYLKPVRKRIQTGDSTMFRVTNVEPVGDWDIRVEGELLYDELFRSPDQVLDSCRISGSGEGGSGSWRVMSKLERKGSEYREVNATFPRYIENSMKATVSEFDRTEYTITVNASTHGGYGNERYLAWHRSATVDPSEEDDYHTLISEGDIFILDPYADSYPDVRAYEALKRADSNTLYRKLNRAFQDGESEQFAAEFCSAGDIEQFLDTFETVTGDRPRGRQKDFVTQVDHSLAVLQGPPGTGKTSYTLAPAVLSRMAAVETGGERLVTLVTAPSHTAVNEAMEDIAEQWTALTDETAVTAATEFVRVRSEDDMADDVAEATDEYVSYIDYYDTDDVGRFVEWVRPHAVEQAPQPTSHLVVFSTPTSFRGLIDKCAGDLFGLDDAEAVMDADHSFVDLLAIDEASMIDVPSAILASAYLRAGAQTLLIGDHRQMEPVQQHDWENEDRRTIEENVPFMSMLNFVRFLRGDLSETEYAFAQSPEIGDGIPITRLDRTYRLHERVAELLTDLVYTDDGIRLKSKETATLETAVSSTVGVDAAMEPSEPVSLIIHDEDESQDANRTEVALIDALLTAIPDPSTDEVGIVTPHNAQKGRLNQRFGGQATIDTVERFQGGERDVMIISATASDPDYVRSEAEFLLNPNRLNVAMSRMKKKLVIVASKSVFEVTPPDAEEFDSTLIWKRLYDALGITEASPATAVWDGELAEFCGDRVVPPKNQASTNMNIFSLSGLGQE